MGEVEPTRLAAWQAFLYSHAALVERLGRELEEECGLPLGWYDALVVLSESRPDGLRLNQLANHLVLSQSGISRLVDRLERAGYVRRSRCPADGRGTIALLTQEGQAVLEAAAPVHLRGVHEHFARHLSDDEALLLQRALSRVVARLRPDRQLLAPPADQGAEAGGEAQGSATPPG